MKIFSIDVIGKDSKEVSWQEVAGTAFVLSPCAGFFSASAMLINLPPSGEPIRTHPLRCGPFAVLEVRLHGPTLCGCGRLDS
jgi:hypothetical protein